MRRLRLLLTLILSCSVIPWGPQGIPSASAQQAGTAEVRLVSQSAWTAPHRPLRLAVRVTNTSDVAMDSISVILSIHFPARSRSAHVLSLTTDVTSPIFAYPFDRKEILLPGRSARFDLAQDLAVLEARGESALYPIRVDVLSAERPVATLRTSTVFLIEPVEPQVRLNLAWTWDLSVPIRFGPGGTFLTDDLERDIAARGRVDTMIRSLAQLDDAPATVVVSSSLIEQLNRMADGYTISRPGGSPQQVGRGQGGSANAADILSLLKDIAGRETVEVVSTPYGDASIPALLRSGLSEDAAELLSRGREVVADSIGAAPQAELFRPPLSAIDAPAVSFLRKRGVRVLLLDPGLIGTESALLTPSATVRLATGDTSMLALRPDTGIVDVIDRIAVLDPRLAAQAALGEMAAAWFELPGTPGRGVALTFSADSPADPRFLGSFSRLAGSSPWLRPVSASWFASFVGEPVRKPLPDSSHTAYSPQYVAQFLRARSALEQFASSVGAAQPMVASLEDRLVDALAGTFVADPGRGSAFISSVRRSIRDTYAKVRVLPGLVTLPSQAGSLPVTITNATGLPMDARIRLIADRRLSFLEGDVAEVTLPAETRTFTFPVRAQTTGRFPVKVELQTSSDPSAVEIIAQNSIVVRSTAFNRFALILTIGAGLFLVGWWGRRFLRPTT